jgi:hypothetical protein
MEVSYLVLDTEAYTFFKVLSYDLQHAINIHLGLLLEGLANI